MEELLQQLFAVSFVGDRLGDLIKLCLDRFISADQTIVTLRVLVLVEGNTSVLRHGPLPQSNHNLQFFLQFCLSLFQFCTVAQHGDDHLHIDR